MQVVQENNLKKIKKGVEVNLYIDNGKEEIVIDNSKKVPLYSKEGFKIISDLWIKIGWDQKYLYGFTWMGRPIIQLPDDIVRIQEVVYSIKPDLIIETGIAHGGSLIFYASLCKAMDKGKVVGVDIDIRKHNRKAIEEHELFPYITMIEGSSIDTDVVGKVRAQIRSGEKVLIILDSCHTYDHVMKELELYSPLVTKGSYIVVTDGSQEYLECSPRARKEYPACTTWKENNPKKAAEVFVKGNNNFVIEDPVFPFNEGNIDFRVTHWPSAYLRRK